jgi:hypothetical protein
MPLDQEAIDQQQTLLGRHAKLGAHTPLRGSL